MHPGPPASTVTVKQELGIVTYAENATTCRKALSVCISGRVCLHCVALKLFCTMRKYYFNYTGRKAFKCRL